MSPPEDFGIERSRTRPFLRLNEAEYRPLPLGDYPTASMVGDAATGDTTRFWTIVGRHRLSLLLLATLGLGAALLYNSLQPTVYRANASFEVQRFNQDFLDMRSLSPTAPEMDVAAPDSEVRTQVELIQSRSIAKRALGTQDLEQRVLRTLPQSVSHKWLPLPGLRPRAVMSSEERALDEVVKHLNVRSRAGVRLVEITFEAKDPTLAADFVNSLLEEFIQANLEERWRTSQQTTEWLTKQLHDLKAKLQASEAELQGYARTWNLIFADEKDTVGRERLRQIQEELVRARADVATHRARYELASSAPPDSLPEVLDDASLKDYRLQLANLRRQLAELRSTMTPKHPKVAKMEAQESELTATFQKACDNILLRIRNEYNAARRRENLLAQEYEAQARLLTNQADKISRYNMLRREVDSSRQLYDSLFQRAKEAGLAAALPTSNIRVVDSARPPLAPYQPRFVINILIGLFCGISAGAGMALIRERSARGFRNPGEVPGYLNRFELGVIPSSSRDKGWRFAHRISLRPSGPVEPVELSSIRNPDSELAESFRLTLPSLMFPSSNGMESYVIIVSSALPGEGKTMVCSNLAIALAKAGRRVLIIDGDSRRPRMHAIFGLDNSVGLTDLLTDRTKHAHRPTTIPNLYVLPAGSCRDADAIFTPRLAHVLKSLRSVFDVTLIDAPPVLNAPDPRILARHADATILVVRANRTDRQAVRLASETLESDGACVLGTILNDWSTKGRVAYRYQQYYHPDRPQKR